MNKTIFAACGAIAIAGLTVTAQILLRHHLALARDASGADHAKCAGRQDHDADRVSGAFER